MWRGCCGWWRRPTSGTWTRRGPDRATRCSSPSSRCFVPCAPTLRSCAPVPLAVVVTSSRCGTDSTRTRPASTLPDAAKALARAWRMRLIAQSLQSVSKRSAKRAVIGARKHRPRPSRPPPRRAQAAEVERLRARPGRALGAAAAAAGGGADPKLSTGSRGGRRGTTACGANAGRRAANVVDHGPDPANVSPEPSVAARSATGSARGTGRR